VTSGVAQVTNFGSFEVYNSTINKNYAVSSTIAQIFDTTSPSIISGTSIHSNIVVTRVELRDELQVSCTVLCFLSDAFKEYLANDPILFSVKETSYAFQLILGQLNIQDNTDIYLENFVVD